MAALATAAHTRLANAKSRYLEAPQTDYFGLKQQRFERVAKLVRYIGHLQPQEL